MALERTHLSAERYPELVGLDWTDRSLHEELEVRRGVRVDTAENRIAAVLPDPGDAELLGIEPTEPCLCVEGISYDKRGLVMAWVTTPSPRHVRRMLGGAGVRSRRR